MSGAAARAPRSVVRTMCCALLCVLIAGCTSLLGPSQPQPAPREEPERTETPPGETPAPASSPGASRTRSNTASASQSLLAQSRAERAAGNYAQATATIERALRIDPNNPALWLELGEIQFELGNAAQARTMAQKALTLADGNRAIESRAERLLRSTR